MQVLVLLDRDYYGELAHRLLEINTTSQPLEYYFKEYPEFPILHEQKLWYQGKVISRNPQLSWVRSELHLDSESCPKSLLEALDEDLDFALSGELRLRLNRNVYYLFETDGKHFPLYDLF
jgi:hypothetical protein